jgi:hypothetical protein
MVVEAPAQVSASPPLTDTDTASPLTSTQKHTHGLSNHSETHTRPLPSPLFRQLLLQHPLLRLHQRILDQLSRALLMPFWMLVHLHLQHYQLGQLPIGFAIGPKVTNLFTFSVTRYESVLKLSRLFVGLSQTQQLVLLCVRVRLLCSRGSHRRLAECAGRRNQLRRRNSHSSPLLLRCCLSVVAQLHLRSSSEEEPGLPPLLLTRIGLSQQRMPSSSLGERWANQKEESSFIGRDLFSFLFQSREAVYAC